jgi:hypothetical protein
MDQLDLDDYCDADPFEAAAVVATSAAPYVLMLFESLSIPPYQHLDDAGCWRNSLDVKLLVGFDDHGDYDQFRKNAILRLYGREFNDRVMTLLIESGRTDCEL